MPPARAVPDHADVAVGGVQAVQVGRGARDVVDELGVGDPALGPDGRGGVVGGGAGRLAVVQVRAEGVVALLGEPPDDLLGRAVVARQVVDHHDATAGAALRGWPGRPRSGRRRGSGSRRSAHGWHHS